MQTTPTSSLINHQTTPVDRRWYYGLAGMIVLFVAVMSAYSILRHYNLWSDIYDLGVGIQVNWNTAYGYPFEQSVEVQNNLGDHIIFIDLLTAVFYRLAPTPETLLILQPLIFALGAISTFRIGMFFLNSPPLAWMAALAYLAQPAAGWAIGYDYHPMAYCAPFALMCFDAAIRQQRFATWGFFILLLMCREDAGMAAAAMGILLAMATPNRQAGLAMACFGLAWFVVTMFILVPYFRGGPSDNIVRYEYFGDTNWEVLVNILTRPDLVIGRLLEDTRRITYIPKLSIPWLGASLLSISSWIGLILTTGLGILSTHSSKFSIESSQTLVALPVVTVGGILGIRRLQSWFPYLAQPRGVLVLVALWAVTLGIQNLTNNTVIINRWQMSYNPLREELAQISPLIPPDAAVSATSKLGAHFCNRRQIMIYPMAIGWPEENFPKLEHRRATHISDSTHPGQTHTRRPRARSRLV